MITCAPDSTNVRCALELLLQTYFLTGTTVQILTREQVRAVEEADATQQILTGEILTREEVCAVEEADATQHAQRLVQQDRRGTQFACFTSTKVPILTGEEQLDEKMGRLPALTSLNLSNNAIKVLSLLALLV